MSEIIDDLQYNGLRILRETEGFSYGHDAVLLANFFRAKRGERFIDIGTGTGAIALLAHAKTGADCVAIDIMPASVDLATRSVAMNGLSSHIETHLADARNISANDFGIFDAAVCNPPYYSGGTESSTEARRVSEFDGTLPIADAAACAARVLKCGGLFFVCYPASRMSALFTALEAVKLPPKRICFVRSKSTKPPYLVLVEAKKLAREGATIEEITLDEN